MIRRLFAAPLVVALLAHPALGQDSNRISLSLHYVNGAQPGMVVVAGPGLDSVRHIIERDLDYSDRFTMQPLPDSVARLTGGAFDPQLFKPFGFAWVVELEPAAGGVDVKLYDVVNNRVQTEATRPVDLRGVGDGRMSIHRVSDSIVTWATGGSGIAASRIAFKMRSGTDDGIWRVDADGANLVRVSHPGGYTDFPAWSPDGSSIAYSEQSDGVWTLYIVRLATGARIRVPTGGSGNAYGPAFSPDGRWLAYQTDPDGSHTNISVVDVAQMCCAHPLTNKLAISISPTYSPDGHRIAFASDRAMNGRPQIYVMDADGSEAGIMVPPEYSATGSAEESYSPVWSPDGTQIAFSRDASGGRQTFTYSIGSQQVVQHTSTGTNEDPSWAPDSRHLVMKSRRSGPEQLWILDLVSATWRAINTPGTIQAPAWSRSLSNP